MGIHVVSYKYSIVQLHVARKGAGGIGYDMILFISL